MDARRSDSLNVARWRGGDYVADYATRDLLPAEVVFLLRHRDELTGRVLELGCGAGRLTGYLAEVSDRVHAIDVSEAMLEHSRRTYPGPTFELRDVRDVAALGEAAFDVVVAPCNILDVFDHETRIALLRDLHGVLAPGGLLLLTAHNRAFAPRLRRPTWLISRDPARVYRQVTRFGRRMRNHRRLVGLERQEADYALINDDAHDFGLLHYYISREAQERQLADAGFAVETVLDRGGHDLAAGDDAPASVHLHYLCRWIDPPGA